MRGSALHAPGVPVALAAPRGLAGAIRPVHPQNSHSLTDAKSRAYNRKHWVIPA